MITGKKPHPQKKQGRARAGSTRAPNWRHGTVNVSKVLLILIGGRAFAKKPRDYSYDLTRRFRQLALKMALSTKFAEGNLTVLDNVELETPKTKSLYQLLAKQDWLNGTLYLEQKEWPNLKLAARNIPDFFVYRTTRANVHWILSKKKLLLTKEAVDWIHRFFRKRDPSRKYKRVSKKAGMFSEEEEEEEFEEEAQEHNTEAIASTETTNAQKQLQQ
jgi:large subunit ribosomal protein L4